MPAPERDGGKDSRHGGKERVIQAAKPLGTVAEIQGAKPLGTGAEGLPFTAVLLAAGSVSDGGRFCLCWRQVSANKDLNH
jgi:hypothetical protein